MSRMGFPGMPERDDPFTASRKRPRAASVTGRAGAFGSRVRIFFLMSRNATDSSAFPALTMAP